jgi:tRNA(fMet)-specific endonuclease VapC
MATEREKWRKLLALLPLPVETSEKYGTILAELETSGEVIGNNDLWIAAHAIAAGLILVTNNEKAFRRVRGLKVQNWAK